MAQVTKTETKEQPKELPEERKIEIRPANVTVNWSGFKFSQVMVFAPDGMIQDDLRDPEIWKRVQADRSKALQKYDEVRIFGPGDAWLVTGTVKKATSTEVFLKIHSSGSFVEADEKLFEDENYRVAFRSGSYWVERKRDGQVMGGGQPTAARQDRRPVRLSRVNGNLTAAATSHLTPTTEMSLWICKGCL